MTDQELLIIYAKRAYKASIEGEWKEVKAYMCKSIQLIDME